MPEKRRVLILPGWPPQLSTWRHIVRQRLPFRADWPHGLAWLHALQSDEP